MNLATVDSIRHASQVQTLALAVSYSLRYDKNFSQFTPTQNLGLCKAIVLPHFLQNLRYIQSETDIKKMKTSLNLSLDDSYMYTVTTSDFWQIQESPLLN